MLAPTMRRGLLYGSQRRQIAYAALDRPVILVQGTQTGRSKPLSCLPSIRQILRLPGRQLGAGLPCRLRSLGPQSRPCGPLAGIAEFCEFRPSVFVNIPTIPNQGGTT